MRIVYRVFLILTTLLLIGCGGGSASTQNVDELSLIISGTLHDESGAPVAGAKVGLDVGPFETVSAADGTFSFETAIPDNQRQSVRLLIVSDTLSNALTLPKIPSTTTEVKLTARVNTADSDAQLDTIEFIAAPPPQETPHATPERTASPTPAPTSAPVESPQPTAASTPAVPQPVSPAISQVTIRDKNPLITWASEGPAPSSFLIYRSTSASGSYTQITELPGATRSYTDSDATSSSDFVYYRMSAKIGAVESVATAPALAVPLADLNNDRCVNSADQDLFSAALDSSPGEPNYRSDADFNNDSTITLADAVIFTSWKGWCAP